MRAWHKVVHELNVTPDEGLCILVLNTAGRHGKSPLALDALRILERMGVTWQEHHFAPVVEALCKEKNVKDALAILDLMRTHNIVPLAETTIPISNAIATDADVASRTTTPAPGSSTPARRPLHSLIPVDTSTGLYVHPAPLPTPMGIPRLFVSSAHRRLGIATHLLMLV